MIFDLARELPSADAAQTMYDVCLVGAGAAGIVLALELRRKGRSVLLLEGGGSDVEDAAQEPYRSVVAGLAHNGVHEGRFRAKGGTTTRWGGQIHRLDALDFAQRSWVAESGWPITLEKLVPYYDRALAWEGMGGVLRSDDAVWQSVGMTTPQFAGVKSYFTRWCPEPRFAVLHGAALEQDAGLTLWLHANVVAVEMDGERTSGVVVRTQRLDGQPVREARFRARQFVFCLGTVESCRFFLQPGEGARPWQRSGLLGRHFQDHVDGDAARVLPRDRRAFAASFDNVVLGQYKYHPKLRLQDAEQRRLGTLNVGGTMHFLSASDERIAGIKSTARKVLRGRFGELRAAELAGAVRDAPLLAKQALRYVREHRVYNPPDAEIHLRVHCEQRPDGASSITLSDERDSLGLLRTRLDWRIDAQELRTMRAFVEVAGQALSGMAEVIPDAGLMRDDGAEFVARCSDGLHHMGGMRMSASPSQGVVDTDCRVHGTSNLYTVSGAVFPTSGYSNPTHTVLALAVRLADRLG